MKSRASSIGSFARRARRITLVGVATAVAALASGPAAADLILSAGAGGVSPWKGDGGYSIMGSVGFNPISEKTRLALEFEYRGSEVAVDLADPDPPLILPVDAYDLRLLFRIVFMPGSLTPYLGFGGGFKLIAVDDRELKVKVGVPADIASTRSYGVFGGLMGLLGVELPLIRDHLAIFVEARADYAWEFTNGVSSLLDNGHAGAFTGLAGLRLTF